MYIIFYPVSIKVFIVKWSRHTRRAMRPLSQHTLQLSTCGIFWVLQPGVKIPAVDQTKRESDPRFPTYDVNVQPGLGSRAWEGGTALIPASLDYLIPLVNLALGLFLRSPKVKPNDSRWIKCCKQSRTAFFLIQWKCWKALSGGAVSYNSQKGWKDGCWVGNILIHCAAPEGPAGAGGCSQPSSLRVRWLVNGQNKYLTVFTGTAGRWGGWTWAGNSETWIQFPAGPQKFCATSGELFTPWMCKCKFL